MPVAAVRLLRLASFRSTHGPRSLVASALFVSLMLAPGLPVRAATRGGMPMRHASPAQMAANVTSAVTPLRVLYVATDGSDDNAGTWTEPWRTLAKAASAALPGDRIYVRAGRYAPFTVTRSGTADHPIAFVGYRWDGSLPVIDGRGATSFVISLSGVHDVRIRNFEVTGGYHDGQDGGGVSVDESSSVLVADNVLHDNSAYGIQVHNSTDTIVRGNDIYGNGEGVDVRHEGAGVKILNNQIHDQDRGMIATPTSVNAHDDTGAIGVAFVWTTGPVLAQGNLIWGNRWMSYDYGWDGGGFEIFGASNVTMTDNTLWDSDDVLETGTSDGVACGNNVFARNTAYGGNSATRTVGMFLRCAENMLITNNTFVNLDYWIYDIDLNSPLYNGEIDGLRILNNINSMNNGKIYAFGQGIPLQTMTIDYNLDHNSGGIVASVDGRGNAATTAELHAWTGMQAHGVDANPLFLDTASRDYRLSQGSPAIDHASRVAPWTDDYNGGAPDIGRFER